MTTQERIEASGLSLQDLASGAGVPYQTARRWSLGESEPKIHQIASLAHVLKCKVTDLIPAPA